MQIEGTVREDPELRFTPSGTVHCTLDVMETEEDGSLKAQHRIVAFGELGERVNENIRQWDRLRVFGYSKTRKWKDRYGKEHEREELIANRVQKLVNKEE